MKHATIYFPLEKEPYTVILTLKNIKGNFSILVMDTKTGDVYYRRKFNKNKIDINFPVHPGKLTIFIIGEAEIEGFLIVPIRKMLDSYIPQKNIERPFKLEDIAIQYVEDLGYTPARIFVKGPKAGLLQISKKHFREYDIPTRVFIKLHELGHFYNKNEADTDRFALHYFLKNGWNLSSAFYALKNVLRVNPANIERLFESITALNKINSHNG